MSTQTNPIVLIHGYSDKGQSFTAWKKELHSAGYSDIRTCNYKTLTNEVTIRDIAEAFDRALRSEAGLDINQDFDAIVHSTGMLVIRTWLAAYANRRCRLKRLIGLAPATFGSPLASKGRSWLGGIFKGNREFGPDFLEAGNQVLDALELGSRFTWDLAHQDMINSDFYGSDAHTPYVFIFCGTKGYSGLQGIANTPGSDGTVRLAGAALNSRKIMLDLTLEPGQGVTETDRLSVFPWSSLDIPVFPIDGLDHGTIMSSPTVNLIGLVVEALKVSDEKSFETWSKNAKKLTQEAWGNNPKWQQFFVHVVDERGDGVPDYYLEILTNYNDTDELKDFKAVQVDVHTYSTDKSFRCFHVNLDKLELDKVKKIKIRLIASSGTQLVEYFGFGGDQVNSDTQQQKADGEWDAMLDISDVLTEKIKIDFFSPLTTTLIEIKLNREPMPLKGQPELFKIIRAYDENAKSGNT